MNLPKRIALKLSGEALGNSKESFDMHFIHKFVKNLIESAYHHEMVLIVGGGNFFRGVESKAFQMDRAKADQMGMLATIMNGIFLEEVFKQYGQKVALLSTISCPQVCESYTFDRADALLKEGYVVICVGGTSVPFFTTDTAVVLKACELKCDLIMKATKVKGVFSKDPVQYLDAEFLHYVSFKDALRLNLKVMDKTAFEMAQDYNIPIIVFSIAESVRDVLYNKCEYTMVSREETC